MKVLSEIEIRDHLKNLDGWYLDNDAIKKDWTFKDFNSAIDFINKVATICDQHDHHPELFNVYNKVNLRFNTHSAGGITAKDMSIAQEIDRVSQI